MVDRKVIQVRFYRSKGSEKEPVRAWLKSLPEDERKRIGEDIKAVEWKWPQGLPLVRKMEPDLWEIRTILPKTKGRVFFTVWQGFLVLLHGFIKKDQKTPKKDLEIARKRRDDVLLGGIE